MQLGDRVELAFEERQQGYGVRPASRLEGKEAHNVARGGDIRVLVKLFRLSDLEHSRQSLLEENDDASQRSSPK